MLIPLIIISALVWFVFQTAREKNNLKWKRRFRPLIPVVVTIIGDVKATRQYYREWPDRRRYRREMKHTHIPDDLSGI